MHAKVIDIRQLKLKISKKINLFTLFNNKNVVNLHS